MHRKFLTCVVPPARSGVVEQSITEAACGFRANGLLSIFFPSSSGAEHELRI